MNIYSQNGSKLKLSRTFQEMNKKNVIKKGENSSKIRTTSQKTNPKFYTPNPSKQFASRRYIIFYFKYK